MNIYANLIINDIFIGSKNNRAQFFWLDQFLRCIITSKIAMKNLRNLATKNFANFREIYMHAGSLSTDQH